MDFRDELCADLPTPRDDEPDSLRADIVAEIEDHLACAYRRELLRGKDRATAKQCALDRFGDPAAVARRLWLDGMRGKIMSRRILVITCISLAVVCLAMVALMGLQMARAERQAAMANARMADAMRQAQLVQAETLKKLAAMSKAAESGRSPDWIPVTFHLSEEARVGLPAANVRVSLGRGSNGWRRDDAIRRVSTETGLADFGVVQPGDWEYSLSLPSGPGEPYWTATGTLNVLPGTTIEKSIICPRQSRSKAIVHPHVKWPTDLADKGLVLGVQVHHEGLMLQPPLRWTTGGFLSDFFLGPEPDRVHRFPGPTLEFWLLSPKKGPVSAESVPLFAEARAWDPSTEMADGTGWQRGDYRLLRLVVLQPTTTASPNKTSRRFRVLAYAAGPNSVDAVYKFDSPPDEWTDPAAPAPSPPVATLGYNSTYVLRLASDPAGFNFRAEEGKPNDWLIPLPENLLQAVREKLKAPDEAKKQR
jgi:hypothetical protein